MIEYVYVRFPNKTEKVHIEVVKKWFIHEPEEIDGMVSFLVGDLNCEMNKEDYVRLFGEE
jgi:hypothetical protein